MKGVKLPSWLVSASLLCIGIGLALLGAARGEAAVVFEKAIRICLECIGIG